MRILITNDDGILAPGIVALYRCLEGLGRLDVVAPATHQSATGHGITVYEPIRVQAVQVQSTFEGFAVEGRPADCVKLALTHLLKEKPDLVISGINDGSNAGMNVIYSGTVAAAAEGAMFGIPAIAVSQAWGKGIDFDLAGKWARAVIDLILQNGLPTDCVLNVNIPPQHNGIPRGLRVVRQSTIPAEDSYERRSDPQGRPYFWATGGSQENNRHVLDSDVQALREGFITLCPLHFDLTHNELKSNLGEKSWSLPTI